MRTCPALETSCAPYISWISMGKAMTTQDAAPVADQPVAWMVKWSTQSIPSFYGSEDSAKEALEQYNQNGAVFPLYSTPPDSLAVAQALEMAAKLQDDEAAFLNEALSHTRLNTSANWSLARQVKECQNRAGAIRSLIPADLAAEAQRQADRTIPFCIQVHGTRFNVGCKLSTVMDCIERAFRYFEEDAARDTK